MRPIKIKNYNEYYNYILKNGRKSSPRDMNTWAVNDITVKFPPMCIPRRSRDNPLIGLVEGFQILAGDFQLEHIRAVAPLAKLELFTHQSAYGPRLIGQLERVCQQLKADPESRRAQVIIARDEQLEMAPCTTSVQYQLVDGVLVSSIYLRSSDATWGLPYDLIQYNIMAAGVAAELEVGVGDLTIHIGNAHIYEFNLTIDQWYNCKLVLPTFNSLWRWQKESSRALAHLDQKNFVESLRELWFDQVCPEYNELPVTAVIPGYIPEAEVIESMENFFHLLCQVQAAVSGLVEPIPEEPTNRQITTAAYALLEEVHELVREVGWKDWKRPPEMTNDQREKVLEEYADVLAFLGLLTNLIINRSGIGYREIATTYLAKAQKNVNRFNGVSGEAGYDGVENL